VTNNNIRRKAKERGRGKGSVTARLATTQRRHTGPLQTLPRGNSPTKTEPTAETYYLLRNLPNGKKLTAYIFSHDLEIYCGK
jgi:hypothetical protein